MSEGSGSFTINLQTAETNMEHTWELNPSG